jgi:hypothetical protein
MATPEVLMYQLPFFSIDRALKLAIRLNTLMHFPTITSRSKKSVKNPMYCSG